MPRPSAADETRTRIVDAALALLDAEGLDALSTRRLARDLGIRGPTLYHYFANKRALLDARAGADRRPGLERRRAQRCADARRPTGRPPCAGTCTVRSRAWRSIRTPSSTSRSRPVERPRTLAGYELVLERLTTAGWPLTTAWQVFLAAENLMLSAALEASRPDVRAARRADPDACP